MLLEWTAVTYSHSTSHSSHAPAASWAKRKPRSSAQPLILPAAARNMISLPSNPSSAWTHAQRIMQPQQGSDPEDPRVQYSATRIWALCQFIPEIGPKATSKVNYNIQAEYFYRHVTPKPCYVPRFCPYVVWIHLYKLLRSFCQYKTRWKRPRPPYNITVICVFYFLIYFIVEQQKGFSAVRNWPFFNFYFNGLSLQKKTTIY